MNNEKFKRITFAESCSKLASWYHNKADEMRALGDDEASIQHVENVRDTYLRFAELGTAARAKRSIRHSSAHRLRIPKGAAS